MDTLEANSSSEKEKLICMVIVTKFMKNAKRHEGIKNVQKIYVIELKKNANQ